MRRNRMFVALCICFLFVVSLFFLPPNSFAQNTNKDDEDNQRKGAGAVGAEAGAGTTEGLSKGTIAAITVGAALIIGGIAAAGGGGGGGGGGAVTTVHH